MGQRTSFVSSLLRGLLTTFILSAVLASTGADLPSSTDYRANPSNPSSIILAKVMQDSKQITELIRLLSHQKAFLESSQDGSLKGDDQKREAAWDMDYGWGGGRFGKRDSLGFAGRFGRSVDKVKAHTKV